MDPSLKFISDWVGHIRGGQAPVDASPCRALFDYLADNQNNLYSDTYYAATCSKLAECKADLLSRVNSILAECYNVDRRTLWVENMVLDRYRVANKYLRDLIPTKFVLWPHESVFTCQIRATGSNPTNENRAWWANPVQDPGDIAEDIVLSVLDYYTMHSNDHSRERSRVMCDRFVGYGRYCNSL